MIQKLINWLIGLFTNLNMDSYYSTMFAEGIAFALVIALGILLVYLARFIIKKTVYKVILKSETKSDDQIINNKVLMRLCLLIPSVLAMKSLGICLPNFPNVIHFFMGVCIVYDIIVITMVLFSVVNTTNDIYNMKQTSKIKPMTGVVQSIKIILIIFCVLLIISFLMGKRVSSVIIGLGTLSAVLLLLFQNVILGFVGSIQLTINDMLRIGDWIVMGQADGTVKEINLTTVKVQNFDNTITTIPTASMVTNQFTNWRGMTESDGRRIMRSITIDSRSIKFCTPEMIERFKQIERIRPYMEQRAQEIAEYNEANKIDTSNIINGRQQTNLGVFRAYINAYLKSNPNLNQNMTRIVRQLQPTEFGVPLQVYVFSKEKDWTRYEEIQSDLFDHIIAAASLFDLKIYQRL